MPAFNAELYVGEAVESILRQTHSDLELLVIDDGSTDRTGEIVSSFRDTRVRYLRNECNLRLAATLNRGLGEARGDIVARMDADDIAYPNRLAVQVAYLARHPDVALVGTGMRRVDDEGRVRDVSVPVEDPDLLRWRQHFSNQIFHPTVALRRKVLRELGLTFGSVPDWACADASFRAVEHLSEDYLLFSLLALRARVVNIPNVLLDFRVHEASVSNSAAAAQLDVARSVSGLLFAQVLGRSIEKEMVELLYFTRATPAPHSDIVKACDVLDEAAAAHKRRFGQSPQVHARIGRDVRLRQRVLRAGRRSAGARFAHYMSSPIMPRDAEEMRLAARALFDERQIHGIKQVRTVILSALRHK